MLLPKLGEQRVVFREGVAYLGKHLVRVKLQGWVGGCWGHRNEGYSTGSTCASDFLTVKKARFMDGSAQINVPFAASTGIQSPYDKRESVECTPQEVSVFVSLHFSPLQPFYAAFDAITRPPIPNTIVTTRGDSRFSSGSVPSRV